MDKPTVAQERSYRHRPITEWAVSERPREKFLEKGGAQLTDAELIAILLGSGCSGKTAVELAREILKKVENNLQVLGELSHRELKGFAGVGQAKAIRIAAALELGRRRQLAALPARPIIRSSAEAYRLAAPLLMDLPHEEFWVLLLNRANRVLAKLQLSEGGLASTAVDPKKIFRRVLEYERACALILVHNHPSGNKLPSQADIQLTEKLCQGARILDLQVLDHIIVAATDYCSFADDGFMPS